MQIMKLSLSLLFQKQNSVHIQYFSLNEKDDSFEYERIETSSPLYNSFLQLSYSISIDKTLLFSFSQNWT